jgi:cell division protein FtsI/penicillin-binding protein 2
MLRFRLKFVLFSLLAIGLFLFVRLYYLQVIRGSEYAEISKNQTLGNSKIFDRGNIFFQNQDGSLLSAATLKDGYTLAINPSQIIDSKSVYEKLIKILDFSSEDFFAKASKNTDPYEEILRRLEQSAGKEILVENIPGVVVSSERWRYYPGKNLASHVLGMVGADNKNRGYGLEKFYEANLNHDNKNLYKNFFAEIFSTVDKATSNKEALEADIVTSLNPDLQAFLEQELNSVKKQYSADTVGGLIINPNNGEIFAMSGKPDFDPNDYGKEDVSTFTNPLVSNMYELGSIIKPLTIAAGLDAGVIKADTTYMDTGCMTIDKKTFCDHDKKAHGKTTMQEVLNQSLNLGVAFVTQKLGNQKFADYFMNFGLGQPTGIDLPNEVSGNIKNLKSTRDIEYMTSSFGQGISMTIIQAARALCTLANGGNLITPHIVNKINYDLGFSKDINPAPKNGIIKKETSEEITRMLVEAVDKALLGGKYKNEHYSVAAKTGTAQMFNPAGGYYEDRYLHSFFGYLPAYDPHFLILLFAVNPKNVSFASDTLTQPFMNLTKFLINFYQLPPDR